MKIKTKKTALFLSSILTLLILFNSCKKEEEILPNVVITPSEIEQRDTVNNNTAKDTLTSLPETPSDTEYEEGTANPEKDSLLNPPASLPQLEQDQASSPISASAYNIEKILPEGYVKDGSIDYTSYLQKAINQYTEIVFPGFPVLINDSGLKIPSNRTIHFVQGSELRLKPSSKANYTVISIRDASNITLYNPYIIGDRYNHKGASGEWGNGIGIYSSNNISIHEARVYNCWGDGIYLGTSGNGTNKNIRLVKPYLKGNRRAGISITDAEDLQIVSPYAGYSDGVAPYCGINIEPNNDKNEIKNITITDPVTEHNKGNGIQLVLSNLYSTTTKKINVNITGHSDIGSYYAFKVGNRRPDTGGYLEGSITTTNPKWKYSENRPLWMSQTDPKLKVYISKPQILGKPGTTVSELSNVESQLKFGLKSTSIPFILSL